MRHLANGKAAVAALCLLIGALSIALWWKAHAAPQAGLVVSVVEQGTIQAALFTSGSLAYRDQARLSAEVVAKVAQIHVKEGDAVRPGQLLIKLDDSALRAELAQFEAQHARSMIDVRRLELELENKRSEARRAAELSTRGMFSQQAADLAATAYDSARFQLEAGRKNVVQNQAALSQRQKLLEKTIIRSPIKGVVISIPIKVGETAVPSAQSMAGSDLMIVADPGSMVVEAAIPEFDIGRVRLGQRAVMTTRAAPNQAFAGRVARIARSMSADAPGKPGGDARAVRTVPVTVELDATRADFIAGMSCDLSLTEASQANALLVPLSALQVEEEHRLASLESLAYGGARSHYVWLVVDGRAVKRKVELGFADVQRQEVRSGLARGDRVVSSPPQLIAALREGDRVGAAAR